MFFSPQSHEGHKGSQRSEAVISAFDKENPVSNIVVDCAFKVHKTIGPGLLEQAYQECLAKEFKKRKVTFISQHHMPIYYEGDLLETPYKLDFLVEECVIVELKSVEKVLPIHEAQTLTYLKLSSFRMALLINFSVPLIKDGIKRFVL